jgi:hypothetical protein
VVGGFDIAARIVEQPAIGRMVRFSTPSTCVRIAGWIPPALAIALATSSKNGLFSAI